VKYMILLQSNPQFLERWEALPKEHRDRFGRDHLALSAELADTGELVAIEALADPALAKRVTVAGEQVVISDGPFAEAKEHLGGYLMVECESIERATEIAARWPSTRFSPMEVRPVMDQGGTEM
jgi:hypothetical protein